MSKPATDRAPHALTLPRPSAGGCPRDLGRTMDLRRYRRAELASMVVERAAFLPARDREVLVGLYARGQSTHSVGALCGVSARVVRKRAKALIGRIFSPEFAFVALHCTTEARAAWPASMRETAMRLFLHGQSLERAARELRLSYHLVRRHRDALRTMAAAAGAMEDAQRERLRAAVAEADARRAEAA